MEANIDFVQLGTNLLVAAISGWVGGKIGVRRTLEQVKGERAFDRRLTWYEKVFDMIWNFRSSSGEFVWELYSPNIWRDENLPKLIAALEKNGDALTEAFNRGKVFADRNVLGELKSARGKVVEILLASRDLRESGSVESVNKQLELASKLEDLDNLLGDLEFNLARYIREQLSLDTVTRDEMRPTRVDPVTRK